DQPLVHSRKDLPDQAAQPPPETRSKTGYEIPFTRHFYKYIPPRPLAEIDADLEKQVAKILDLLREVEQ
ncbi:hypothetical protein, partial [Micromonospora sp. DT229]|uniref:hypothetical protein n=1 Tax=Micromonospora sp. DT229 TaxID=3393430 RepID=UPI003CF63796